MTEEARRALTGRRALVYHALHFVEGAAPAGGRQRHGAGRRVSGIVGFFQSVEDCAL
jgi:hypothetical protein